MGAWPMKDRKQKRVAIRGRGTLARPTDVGNLDRFATGLGRGVGVFAGGIQMRRTQLAIELGSTLLELRERVTSTRKREKEMRQHFLKPQEYLLGQTEIGVKWSLLDRMLTALGQ